jgi:hypothetical protein
MDGFSQVCDEEIEEHQAFSLAIHCHGSSSFEGGLLIIHCCQDCIRLCFRILQTSSFRATNITVRGW